MGMAASQARFLGLTARKTNTEYEGQQINQQRTVLGNQSANYYNQLLGMTVPTPPSKTDFTKTVYTFTDGALSNSITSMIAQKDGTYLISYTSTWTNDFSVISSNPVQYTREEIPGSSPVDYNYYVGAKKLRGLGTGTIPDEDFSYKDTYTDASTGETIVVTGIKKDKDGYYTIDDSGKRTAYTQKGTIEKDFYDGKDEYLKSLSMDQIENLYKEEDQYLEQLKQKYGYTDDWMVRYVQNLSTGTWSPYFVNKQVLDNATYNDKGASQSLIKTYTVGSAQETEEIKGVEARMEQDASGRIINITLRPGEEDEVTYAVTTNTVSDEAKYQDAMNQYEYDKNEYEQTIQEINAKIEIVQAQDRNLELRLKQLDTEQEAIQTEMDAVQKVIEKNTESTFKTFG